MNKIATIGPTRRKFDVPTFYRMSDLGIIGERDRIELIDGDLIDMAPIGDDHINNVNMLNEMLVLACLGRATVSVQNPARLDGWNQPQPDFAVFRGSAAENLSNPAPPPSDIILLVEVAESSLKYDRTVKLKLYARFGVAEYWIVDLPNRRVVVHRRPQAGGYADVETLTIGRELALAAAPEIVIDLRRLLG